MTRTKLLKNRIKRLEELIQSDRNLIQNAPTDRGKKVGKDCLEMHLKALKRLEKELYELTVFNLKTK